MRVVAVLPGGSTLEHTASWALRDKVSKAVICETFNPDVVRRLNTVKYEAVPILEYLGEFNRALSAL